MMTVDDMAAAARVRGAREADWVGAPFVLSRPTGSVIGREVTDTFTSADAAVEALRRRRIPAIVGALPFRPGATTALMAPARLDHHDGPLRPAVGPAFAGPPDIGNATLAEFPSREEHGERIGAALADLRASPPSVHKVVLARTVQVNIERPVDPYHLLSRLIDLDTAGNGFAVDLAAAGNADPAAAGNSDLPSPAAFLVGSSPEVLISRRGDRIEAHPLAGSAPRSDDPAADRRNAETLASSDKNRAEHAYLVEHLRTVLAPLCSRLDIPAEPTVTSTPQLWHLGTPITGILADPVPSALEVALALHPTPAVCGTPTDAALRLITDLEGDRGFYAGAVGWTDVAGDGEWLVAIRCATLSTDRQTVTARAGGGIVAESLIQDEIDETTTKFRTILTALGYRG